MKLKQTGKTGTNGMDYFDICSNNFKSQFGYISKKGTKWKLYINIKGDKNYFDGDFSECIKRAEELTGVKF